MSGSGGLTAEQKRKIEENRQKALAKRAQKTSPNKSDYGVNNNRTSGNIQKTVNFPPSINKTSVTSTSKPVSATEVHHSGNLFKGNNLPRQTSYSSSYNKNSLSNQINKHSAYTLSNQNVVSLSSQNSSTGTYRPYTGISGGTSNNVQVTVQINQSVTLLQEIVLQVLDCINHLLQQPHILLTQNQHRTLQELFHPKKKLEINRGIYLVLVLSQSKDNVY